MAPLPSGTFTTGSDPPEGVAVRTFGTLPFASMIPSFQGPGLRKHPGVGLCRPVVNGATPDSRRRSGCRPWSTELDSFQAPAFRPG